MSFYRRLGQNKSNMDSPTRTLRLLQLAMMASIILYVLMGERLAPLRVPNAAVFYVISLVSITTIGIILVVRRTLVQQSLDTLRDRPNDAAALTRWRSGYIVTYALAESQALFGLVLRFLGFSLSQVAPFYVAGFILMLFFSPRSPSRELT
jgi:hypothetical protein